jgi:hypothetical protein
MAGWGEPVPAVQRASSLDHRVPEEIHVRSLQNREFGYCSIRRRDLIYESTFRLSDEDGKCLLIWEIRYQLFRLPDLVTRNIIAAGVHRNMLKSLGTIRRLALTHPVAVYPRKELFEARRGHVPAA